MKCITGILLCVYLIACNAAPPVPPSVERDKMQAGLLRLLLTKDGSLTYTLANNSPMDMKTIRNPIVDYIKPMIAGARQMVKSKQLPFSVLVMHQVDTTSNSFRQTIQALKALGIEDYKVISIEPPVK